MKHLLFVFVLALTACGGSAQVQPQASQQPAGSNVAAFMGDSITQYWPLSNYDKAPAVNLGVQGQLTIQMQARFNDQVVAIAPGVVVILGGLNDLSVQGPANTNTDAIRMMAEQATTAGIKVIICSVTPINEAIPRTGYPLHNSDIVAFNQKLITLAQEGGYLYADYFDEMVNSDGTQNTALFNDAAHPNADGYARMWTVVGPLIDEDLQ